MRKAIGNTSGLRLERIENMVGGNGIPDVLAIREGRVRFLEMKVAKGIPKRNMTPLLGAEKGLRRDQKNWLLDWAGHGGTAYVVIGIIGSRMHLAVSARYADEINAAPLSWLLQQAKCSGPGPEFWPQFLERCL